MQDYRNVPMREAIRAGYRTAQMVHTAIVEHPRQEDETQEEYADRIMLLITQELMQQFGLRMKTCD